MVQCEMCGTETSAPKTVKVEGAELQVCADCADFGTEVQSGNSESASSKYSTSESSNSGTSGGTSSSSAGGSSTSHRKDMFDEMDEVVQDYDRRIREARESAGLSQAELANELNEKASFIRKLERGESLPSDRIRRKLERAMDIELVEGGGDDDGEWSGGDSATGMTLGDVVKRKD